MCRPQRFRRSRTLLVRFFHQPRLFQQKDDGRQQHELDDDARQRRYERARNKYREGIISGGEDERVHYAVYKAADEHGAHELDVQVQRALTRAHEPAQHARRKAVGGQLAQHAGQISHRRHAR